MRDLLNGSPGGGEEEEENNRSPLSAEAPELSSHSSDEVPLYFISFQSFSLFTLFTVHLYKFIHSHSFITFAEFRSSFFIAASSGRGSPLGCQAKIRTRGRLTAGRQATMNFIFVLDSGEPNGLLS
jgi:hypothetical protein